MAPQDADYPAVLPYSRSRSLFLQAGHEDLAPEERTVRGTFVTGLNDNDIARLDLFEGDPHRRRARDAYVVPLTAPELPSLDNLPSPISAETYIYAGSISDLSPELWSYDDFVRENAWKWVGTGERDEYYAEVDRRRDMDGKTLQTANVNAENGTDTADDGRTVVAEVRQ
ncbi:hypothetical protein BN946_scf184945.g30 [Trametes cinnabarina]|uniref:Gamma-glutamylcyclotransferase AIG2-like domain-containing protein n=1 Tax=Pycnoporus cinnabarinus TaxID=5643 RepID=A0A060SR86_PYCCI|nr:hypothetical protein BN946_scf184945.g30 [Trametes cinnabarina]